MKTQGQLIAACGLAVLFAIATLTAARAFGRTLPGQQSSPQASQPSQQQQNAQPAQQSAPAQPSQPSGSNSAEPGPSLRNPEGAQQGQPAQQGQGAAQGQAAPQVTPAEQQAYQTIVKELDPAKQIAEVKAFQQAYPKSIYLSDVYFFGANAEEQQNDALDALSFGEKSLQLQPTNLRSLIIVAGLLPLPQTLQGTTDQKEQQLTQSETDANSALQLLAKVPQPPTETPAQFANSKQLVAAQLHAALGMAHLQKALLAPKPPDQTELAAAEQEFKTAVNVPQPNARDFYRLGEVYARENKLDDSLNAFTQCAKLSQGKLIATYANKMIDRIKAAQAAQAKQGTQTSQPASQQ